MEAFLECDTMSAGEIGETGPVGAAILAWIVAGWVFVNGPLSGNLNLVFAGGFALFGVAILAGKA